MASSSIDSLLRITEPSRAPVEVARSSTSAAKPFEELFSRAAQSTVPRDPSRPESTMSLPDEPSVPEQREADDHSSLPDDSHLHADSDEADQAKPAKTAAPDVSEEEQLQAENDVLEISSAAAAQTPSTPLSEEEPPFASSGQSSDDKSPAEDAMAAATATGKTNDRKQTADSVAAPPNRQTGNHENQPGSARISQPITPELTAEVGTDAEGQPAASADGTTTQEIGTDARQAAAQDAPIELAAQETESPQPTDSPPTDHPASGSRSRPAKDDGPSGRGDDLGNSDQPHAKDRQAIQTPNLPPGIDRAADTPRANDPESVSATRPTQVAETATPVSTDSISSSGIADRALDRMTAARSVQPARQTSEPPPAPTVDRSRFVGRVGSALRLAQSRDGQMQLRLSPPELGSLRLEISVKQGVLTATMETETAAARHILLENLPALRERLAGQEIRIERFDVRHEGGEQSQNRAAQERPGDQPRGRPGTLQRQADEPAGLARGILPLATRFNQPSPDGLDVVI